MIFGLEFGKECWNFYHHRLLDLERGPGYGIVGQHTEATAISLPRWPWGIAYGVFRLYLESQIFVTKAGSEMGTLWYNFGLRFHLLTVVMDRKAGRSLWNSTIEDIKDSSTGIGVIGTMNLVSRRKRTSVFSLKCSSRLCHPCGLSFICRSC